jgi:hypothetical protein
MKLLVPIVAALVIVSAFARADEGPTPSEQIVELYEADNCPGIEAAYKAHPQFAFGPLVRSVIAGCLTDKKKAEELFLSAEKERPNNQVILILHARSLRKESPEKAMDLWRKVRLYARSESIKRMAEDYISGVVDLNEEEEKLSIGRNTLGWIYAQAGEVYTSNPGQDPLGSGTSPSSSWGNNYVLRARLKNETTWGDYGPQLSTVAATYYANHFNDSYTGRFDFPVGIDAGDFGSVIFTPFAAHELQGRTSYHTSWGLGIMGVALNNDYRQSVQAIISRDRYYDPTTQTQAGDHYRFEYDWLFYPEGKEISFGTFIEHVHAAVDSEDSDQSTVNYSHNDLGALFTFLLKLNYIEFGLSPTVTYRQDTNDSSYFVNSIATTKRRHDWDVDLRAFVAVPLWRSTRLELFYDYNQVFSNFGAADVTSSGSVQNYNVLNRSYGLNVDLQVDWL